MLATGVEAQSTWQEYTYPDQQFAVSFPSQPTVATMPFKAANGTAVTETLYSVRQETGLFQVAVIEFANAGIDQTTAIGQAVDGLVKKATSSSIFRLAFNEITVDTSTSLATTEVT